MNGWDVAGLIATGLGVYAAMPQLISSFKDPRSLDSLTYTLTVCLLLNSSIWLAVDWHLHLPIFVLSGSIGTSIILILLVQQIRHRRKS